MILYLNMLNFIRTKIFFGNDKYSVKIEFSWKDTLKNSFVSSYNISFEYNCILFNLAICNNFIAKLVNPDQDEELKLKEAIKMLEISAGIIDKIKRELQLDMFEKEIPNDLSSIYSTFVNKIFFVL